jgi:pimeloyl-ACP methyl ester carboxylesterase
VETSGKLDRGDGVRLAWARLAGTGPTVVFCPGYKSDMAGQKATELAAFCAAHGQAFLRFDYSGHGTSDGRFEDGTIGRWLADALALIDALTTGKLVIVGSSMGGWIALLLALARPDRVAALVGVAAAPDFTEGLMWEAMSFAERREVMERGMIMVPNPYGGAYPVTRALIEDGRAHLLLSGPIALDCQIRLLHGQRDAEVPWETALRIAERVAAPDVRTTLIKDGDHRLSRPEDLALLCAVVGELVSQDGG